MKKTFAQIKDFIGDDGLGAEQFIRELWISYHAAERRIGGEVVNNLLAYGPGGYGKSTIVRKFFDALGLTYKVFDANSETSVEKLFGGLNYVEYIERGLTRYNVQDSWMASEYVIFEEGLSMPVKTITALRNILQSGVFVNGTDEIKIKTKWIVMATNRNPDMFAGNEDMEALLSRFLYRCKVDWSHLSFEEKIEAYTKIIENEALVNIDEYETKLLAKIFATNDGASPRLAKLIAGRTDISKEFFGEAGIDVICNELGWQAEGLEEMLRHDAEKAIQKVVDEQLSIVGKIETNVLSSNNGNRMQILKLAYDMVNKCRSAISDACSNQRKILGSDPYVAVNALTTIAQKEEQLKKIAAEIVLS